MNDTNYTKRQDGGEPLGQGGEAGAVIHIYSVTRRNKMIGNKDYLIKFLKAELDLFPLASPHYVFIKNNRRIQVSKTMLQLENLEFRQILKELSETKESL